MHRAWLDAKAKADRLYWQLHRERINAQRRQRYARRTPSTAENSRRERASEGSRLASLAGLPPKGMTLPTHGTDLSHPRGSVQVRPSRPSRPTKFRKVRMYGF